MSTSIKLISTELSRPHTMTSSATTWGELKDEIESQGILSNLDSMVAVLSTTKTTLDLPSALLPTGISEYKIYFSQKAIKAGK